MTSPEAVAVMGKDPRVQFDSNGGAPSGPDSAFQNAMIPMGVPVDDAAEGQVVVAHEADSADTEFAAANWMDWTRVALDLVLTIAFFFVTASVATHARTSSAPMHIHEMPIYLKEDILLGPMWTKANAKKGDSPAVKLGKFKAEVGRACVDSIAPYAMLPTEVTGGLMSQHPMCVCIAEAADSTAAKTCMLSKTHPSTNSDWYKGSFAPAMALWFLSSLATSVGTLPYAQTYLTGPPGSGFSGLRGVKPQASPVVYTTSTVLVILYGFCVVLMVVVPLCICAIEFPGDLKHLQGTGMMIAFSCIGLLSMLAFNCRTVVGFVAYEMNVVGQGDRDNWTDRVQMSSKNWIVYTHFLVSAPAIAHVLHLTQQWTEFHTVLNTTLVLSTLFAVDGFSSEMANYWLHLTHKGHVALWNSQTKQSEHREKAEQWNVKSTHTTLGMMRLFAITVNAVVLMLLFTLAYPIQIDDQTTSRGVFVIVVVVYASVFLLPDLVREFTDRVSFNAIQFRQHGDLVVRALTLFFIWNASATDRG